jgi:DNA-3-methyladenine glycosylase
MEDNVLIKRPLLLQIQIDNVVRIIDYVAQLKMNPLQKDFYKETPLIVAPGLLGKKLVRNYRGVLLSGMINETEAYLGYEDSASHAFKGKTNRNAVMFGESGNAYIYLIYGIYHMLNVVTGAPDIPWAVLIRSVVPLNGLDTMKRLRGRKKNLTDGPGKMCSAFAIDRKLNGLDLTRKKRLWIEEYETISDSQIITSPRVGIDYALKEHRTAKWRFSIRASALS